MSLNIDNYSAWANMNLGDRPDAIASLDRAGKGVADIRDTTSGWSRFFGTSSYRTARDTARADFQRALNERFGTQISTAVMRSVGPDLTAVAIRNAVAQARCCAMRGSLTPTNDRCFKLTDGNLTVTQATINGMTQEGRVALTHFLKASNAANDLLGRTPVGDADLADMAQCTETIQKKLVEAKVSLQMAFADAPQHLDSDAVRRLSNHCDALVGKLQSHLEHVRDLNANGPLSQGAQDRFRDVWHDSFKLACVTLKSQLLDNAAAVTALDNLARTPKDAFNFVMSKDFKDELISRIESALERDCGANPLPKGTVKKTVAKSYESVLNSRPWAPIVKTFTGAQMGHSFQLTSTITPGKHVAGVGENYPPHVNGYMCHSAGEKDHAVNLAVSSLKIDDGQGAPRTVFTGVRHGVHCAWEIKNATERAQANINRATDAVKAAFSAYLASHQDLPEGQEIRLPMTSVSLLTPEWVRPILSALQGKNTNNEKMMLREQTAAWNALNGRPMQISVNGRTYTVRPEIATFNFGVNKGGVGAFSGIVGGWGVSDQMNLSALQTLRARTEAFCSDASQPTSKRLAAQKLFRQLTDILANEDERTDGHDAYKAAARVAVLTSLLDGVPCWNCKSGKDRTGELDVECKFLATLIARGHDIPEPGAALTDEQKSLFRTIALEAGNHEMQEYNTGIAGYKTSGVDSISERLGGSAAKAFHKGGAGAVST